MFTHHQRLLLFVSPQVVTTFIIVLVLVFGDGPGPELDGKCVLLLREEKGSDEESG